MVKGSMNSYRLYQFLFFFLFFNIVHFAIYLDNIDFLRNDKFL